jgi:ssDNA-binding Zn-finger/Zn-ribbon topoisomerase 1
MTKHETNFESEGKKGVRIGFIVGTLIALGMLEASYNAFKEDDSTYGIVFIIIGIAVFFISYAQGANMITGACPYCGHKILTYKNQLNTKCKACRKHIVIKDNKFIGFD